MMVHGFPDKISALQFEWALQNPHKSIAVRDRAATLKGLGSRYKVKAKVAPLQPHAFHSPPMRSHVRGCRFGLLSRWRR